MVGESEHAERHEASGYGTAGAAGLHATAERLRHGVGLLEGEADALCEGDEHGLCAVVMIFGAFSKRPGAVEVDAHEFTSLCFVADMVGNPSIALPVTPRGRAKGECPRWRAKGVIIRGTVACYSFVQVGERQAGMREEYRTLAAGIEASGEFEDRRSRFIAQMRHVESEREAQGFIDEVRARHHDARHNVPAWVLSDGRERCSDDGEPSRTGGTPTLEVLRGAGLADVCCVVTRYFGGTLLGPGGLKRAYTAATQEAVGMAERDGSLVTMGLCTRVTCVIPYSSYGRVERLVSDCGGRVKDSVFAQDVQLTIAFRSGEETRFVDAMRELSAGEDLCVVGEPSFAEL